LRFIAISFGHSPGGMLAKYLSKLLIQSDLLPPSYLTECVPVV
jgi:hypothetical protein